MPRIGIEGTLSDIKGALQERGYELVELRQEQDAQNCDCCVISGQDKDVMGMSNAAIQGSVINAHGMTADEVCEQVDSRFQ
ncbi:YkuS family protein [Sediminibacillus massiliensis]|uniref:YkuS family protein n=1 Tax=Sediminibacillus massiliensis TaxID=1926277 RepID=UPI000988355C|nr:YkuS family protein [Sediminibacillus massiliensis]